MSLFKYKLQDQIVVPKHKPAKILNYGEAYKKSGFTVKVLILSGDKTSEK